jgi:hypothetical protein
MGENDVAVDRVSAAAPPIPQEGLSEVLSKWVGRGDLWDSLAAPADIETQDNWSADDIQSRASRVLIERVQFLIARWPDRVSTWCDILPAAKENSRVVRDAPFSGVKWARTIVRYGWPPNAFLGRQSIRQADFLMLTALRWTLGRLATVRRQARRLFADVGSPVWRQLDAAETILALDPVASAPAIRPSRHELVAVRREGNPWGAVADVAVELLDLDTSIESLATRLLIPDEDIRWRLFHLAVLGTVLISLRRVGCELKSVGPISPGWSRPCFLVKDPTGADWDLWFEASGIWAYYKELSPYVEATSGLGGPTRPLGADLLLIRPRDRALILECKYSAAKEMVARNGYYQAIAYAAEVRTKLAANVTSFAIGPDCVVDGPGFTSSVAGRIGIAPPSEIQNLIELVLSAAGVRATTEAQC